MRRGIGCWNFKLKWLVFSFDLQL
ncbi:hypothetical protein OIU76_003139 [Salix suchowensis]|nr:hypothetical protein OIU76_003139 [Salix suchowensis]